MREIMTIESIERLPGCCALHEVRGMEVEEEDIGDDDIPYQTGHAHTAVTNSDDQPTVEKKLMAKGFVQVANWNNEDGVRLNLWFRGPKDHTMKSFPRAPRTARVRRPRRR